VLHVVPFAQDGGDASALLDYIEQLPPPERFAGIELQAPILFLPNVFEPRFCRRLVELYETHGGEVSGFMREVEGKTVMLQDHAHKRRKDYIIEDPDVIRQTQARIQRRVKPEILKVYSFNATRMERYIVSCYSAEDRGHFRAHRDNTTKGTAHRRFAVSINLNAEFEGGEISFPEYGPRSFKPPPGGAVIFPCALLHAVSPVTRGRRYAFLPFLYDDEAARIREANNQFLGEGVGPTRRTRRRVGRSRDGGELGGSAPPPAGLTPGGVSGAATSRFCDHLPLVFFIDFIAGSATYRPSSLVRGVVRRRS
jgi:predicted 2-oxoglutarate/Fe(II)-dependent dioxygenase YbiX